MADLQDQITALRTRWEAEPNSRVFVQLAEAYRRSGHPKQALEVLRQGLSRVPDYLSGQVALGRCYLDLQKPEAAVEVLERVLKRDPTHLVANKLLIRAHLDGSNVKAAKERLDHYRLLNDGDPVIEELQQNIRDVEKRLAGPSAAAEVDATVRLEALVAESGVRKPMPAATPPSATATAATATAAPEPEPTSAAKAAEAVSSTDTVMLTPAMLADAQAAAAAASSTEPEVEATPVEPTVREEPEVAAAEPMQDASIDEVEAMGQPEAEVASDVEVVADTDLLAEAAVEPEAAVELEAEVEPEAEIAAEGDLFAFDGASTEADEPSLQQAPAPAFAEAGQEGDGGEEDLFPDLGGTEALAAADDEEDLFGDLFGSLEEDEDVFAQELASEGLFTDFAADAAEAPAIEGPALQDLATEPAIEALAVDEVTSEDPFAEDPFAEEPIAEEPIAEEPIAEEPIAEEPAAIDHPMAQGFSAPPIEPVEAVDVSPEALEPEAPEPVTPEPVEAPPSPATATLGQLYLQQGHHGEARKIFREVLAREPMNPVALAGLAALDRARDKPLRAVDLLRDADPKADVTARKIVMLGNYLQRLREGAANSAEGAV